MYAFEPLQRFISQSRYEMNRCLDRCATYPPMIKPIVLRSAGGRKAKTNLDFKSDLKNMTVAVSRVIRVSRRVGIICLENSTTECCLQPSTVTGF